MTRGALEGVRVIDLSRLSPGPYCSMLLGDMGAEVIKVDPAGPVREIPGDPMGRNKKSVRLNLKSAEGQAVLHRLVATADVVLEGFRPGVAARLGAGYEALSAINPRLVYCSVTGWGQDGPFAQRAGHDIDYIAIAGALGVIGRAGQPPVPPLNLVGDFGGGGLFAAFGVMVALFERERSGVGQYIDAAMVDGAMSLMVQTFGVHAAGMPVGRGTGFLDTGAPYYDVYETADGKFVAVGAIEPQFFTEVWTRLAPDVDMDQSDQSRWPEMRAIMRERFKQRTRAEWEAVFEGADACVVAVLDLDEVASHPHNKAREAMVAVNGVMLPAPAPRLSRTPGSVRHGPPPPGAQTDELLREVGFGQDEIESMRSHGAIA